MKTVAIGTLILLLIPCHPAVAANIRLDEGGAVGAGAAATGAAFSRMPVDQVRSLLLQWLVTAKVDADTAREVTALWADKQLVAGLSAEDTLDRLMESLATADESVRDLTNAAQRGAVMPALNLEGPRSEPFVRDQLRLFAGRYLAQHRYYDEALAHLEALEPEQLVDPASLFFYRAACRLKLLKPAEAADDLALLLNNTLDVPQRFRSVAELMQKEAAESADGLPQVARLMSDVQRRLDLQNADDPVQKREDEVIAALDKLLKEMEEQQQQQQSGGQGSGQQQQPGEQGAEQSTLRTGSPREGDADHEDLTENGSWGMLDKQAETKARELIRQQFPPNYLDAISRYTKKIAEQKE